MKQGENADILQEKGLRINLCKNDKFHGRRIEGMVIKVQNGVFSNEYDESRKTQKSGKENKEQVRNGSVFGGGLKQKLDPVALKKEQAQKRAMKIWTDAASAEQKIDIDLEERAAHMDELRQKMKELQGQVNSISEEQEALKEQYGITDDGPKPAEYVSRYMELEKAKGEFQRQLDEANQGYLEESNIIKGIKKGRLKSHAMADAQKEKDEMMIEASKEAAFGMMNEVKEKIDEEQAEQKEKAEEKAEKKEAEEELREAIREKTEGRKSDEEEPALEVTEAEDFIQLESVKEEVQKEVKKMVNEMNLLVEDLKGAAVDETL